VAAAVGIAVLLAVSPSSAGAASELMLKAVHTPLSLKAPTAHAAHDVHRTATAAHAIKGAAAKTKGTSSPLFASAAIAARAATAPVAASAVHQPSGKVQAAGKAAVKVAALAKSVSAAVTASQQNRAALVRSRMSKMPLHTAMHIVETGAAHSLAQADKNAVDAALLRAALSRPGVRQREKVAAAAAARAAANKPSAAWLAGAKSLADRNPYAAMNVAGTQQQQLRQKGGNAQGHGRRGGKLAALAHAKRGAHVLHGRTALSHTSYSEEESQAYTAQAGTHPIDLGGNDKIISTIHPDDNGEIERPDYNDPYVRKTTSLGTPVAPADVQRHWAHGHYHPYHIVHRDDRYVSVGRLLSHRGGVTRREQKMPTMQEEEEGGVDTEEEQPAEAEEEEEDCQWGKDVYGRCYTECTPAKDDYTKCHDGSPLWHDPVPLNKLCVGRENATWCQEPYGEEVEEGGEEPEEKARTVQLASVGGARGEVLGGSAYGKNAAAAPTLAGGVPVAGGKVVWLPLDSLTKSAVSPSQGAPMGANGNSQFVTMAAQPATVTPQVPKWDPKKFSKDVLYGPNGKPLYAFYARDADGNSAAAVTIEKGGGQLASSQPKDDGAGLSATDKEIERKVLFKLLREEEKETSNVRQQKLEEKSAAVRPGGSWVASLVVSLALFAPLLCH